MAAIGIIVVAGFVGVVVIGILAALAIPRFSQASTRAKEKEGEAVLKQVYTLENAYYANTGAYTSALEELRSVGWEPTTMLNFSSVEVAAADSTELCVHVLPREGRGVQPIRIITSGEIQHGVRCGDGSYASDRDAVMGAAGLADDVQSAVAAWRREHGRLPATEAELQEAYPRAKDDPDFVIVLSPGAAERFCLYIARRTEPPSRPLLSLDGTGAGYAGGDCTGAVVSQPAR